MLLRLLTPSPYNKRGDQKYRPSNSSSSVVCKRGRRVREREQADSNQYVRKDEGRSISMSRETAIKMNEGGKRTKKE